MAGRMNLGAAPFRQALFCALFPRGAPALARCGPAPLSDEDRRRRGVSAACTRRHVGRARSVSPSHQLRQADHAVRSRSCGTCVLRREAAGEVHAERGDCTHVGAAARMRVGRAHRLRPLGVAPPVSWTVVSTGTKCRLIVGRPLLPPPPTTRTPTTARPRTSTPHTYHTCPPPPIFRERV